MFGPRKKDFAKEVVIKEFNTEYNEDREDQGHEEVQKMDLVDYLDSLEDENDPSPNGIALEEIVDIPPTLLLANFIRERSAGAHLTSLTSLLEDDENVLELLDSMKDDPTLNDIVFTKGSKETYYYSNKFMSDNYAMIAALVEDKDLTKTIVEMVRWNGKTYPCPTPAYYFQNSPYFNSKEEIDVAIEAIFANPSYEDIGELTTGNNVRYLFSSLHMSQKYAKALAENTEYGEYGY